MMQRGYVTGEAPRTRSIRFVFGVLVSLLKRSAILALAFITLFGNYQSGPLKVEQAEAASPVTIILKVGSTTPWTVPSDWDNNNNTIVVVGSGGSGATALVASSGAGGGGGAYASTTNLTLTPGGTVSFQVGRSGSSTASTTWFSSTAIVHAGGGGDVSSTFGGNPGVVIAGTGFSGGYGGSGQSNDNGQGGGGGGGAGGKFGAGKIGGSGGGGTSPQGGGGGGGNGNGSVGANGGTDGGAGGNGNGGTGAGTGGVNAAGGAGTVNTGAGGGGGDGTLSSTFYAGGAGATSTDSANGILGSGGGGGGGGGNTRTSATGNNGGAGANGAAGAGGGGGGGCRDTGCTPGVGGTGGSGYIVITYTPYTPPITISGTLYTDEGVTPLTGSSKTIAMAIGTSTRSVHSTTTTSGTGAFSFSIAGGGGVGASTPITVWVEDGFNNTRAVTFTKATSTNTTITDLNLYQNRVIVRHEGTSGTSTNISNMSFYDGDDNAYIQYTANAGTLTVNSGNELHIWTGKTFAPTSTVTIRGNASSTSLVDGSLHLPASAIYTAGGTTTLAGNFFASSSASFNPTTTPLFFNATTTGKSISYATLSSLGTTTFNGSGGGWTFSTTSTVSNLTITTGTVVQPSGGLTITGNYANSGSFTNSSATTTFNSASVQTIGGVATGSSAFGNLVFVGAGTKTFSNNASSSNLMVNTGATLVAPAGGVLSVSGNFNQNGTFTAGSGTTTFDGTSAQVATGTMTGTSALGNVIFAGAGTKTIGANVTASNFVVATSSGMVTTPATLTLTGQLTNNSSLNAPTSTLTVAGAVTNTGTFTAPSSTISITGNLLNTGTLTATSASTSITGNLTNSGTFGAPAKLAIGGDYSNSGTFIHNSGTTTITTATSTHTLSGNMTGTSAWNNLVVQGEAGGGSGSTGWISPNSNVAAVWAGPEYAYSSDDTDSYSNSSEADQWWQFNDLQSLVTGNVIGIVVRTESADISCSSPFPYLKLSWNGGTNGTDPYSFSILGNNVYDETGGATDTWGRVWSSSDFSTSNFAVGISGGICGLGEVGLDHIQVNIYYEGGGATTTFSNAFTANNFTASSSGGGLIFAAGATNTIQNNATIVGWSGGEKNLRSTSAGTKWGLDINGTYDIDYVNVKDGDACETGSDITGTGIYDSGNNLCWTFSEGGGGGGITISGYLYSDEGSTVIQGTKTINVVVGTSTPGTVYATTTRGTTGAWAVNLDASHGITGSIPITIYVDGDATTRAVLVTKAVNSSSISSLPLYQNRVIVSHEGTGTSTTLSDMNNYDGGNDTDIQYTTDGSSLSVRTGNELYIAGGKTFAPGGAVTINGNASTSPYDGSLRIATGATYTAAGTTTIAGSFTASSTAIFTATTSPLLFTATTTGKTISATSTIGVGSVRFNGSGGGWTFGQNATTSTFTISNGTVVAPSALTIEGDYTNTGTFTHNSGTVYFVGSTTASGNLTGSSAFNHIETLRNDVFNVAFSNNIGAPSLVIDSANSVLYIGTVANGVIYRCPLSTGCDSGGDFTIATNTAATSIDALAVDSTNGVLYAGGTAVNAPIYRCALSTGCDSAGDFTTAYNSIEEEILSLTIDSVNGVLYAGTGNVEGIIYRCLLSTDCNEGSDFTTINTAAEDIYSLTIDSTNGVLYAGSRSGVDGVLYHCLLSTDCNQVGDFTIATTTSFPTYSFTIDSTNGVLYAGGGGAILRCLFSTGCDSAGDFTTATSAAITYYSLTIDSTNGVLYAGGASTNAIIFRCTLSTGCDSAGDFTTATSTSETEIRSLTIDSTNGVLYAGSNPNGVIYRSETSVPTQFQSSASTTNLAVGNSMRLVAPTSGTLSIAGNLTQDGTFVPGSGTTTFNGASLQSATGTLTFNNLEITNGSATTSLNASTSVAGHFKVATPGARVALLRSATTTVGTLTLAGAGGNTVKIRSTTDGTKAGLRVTNALSATYVDVKDSSASSTFGLLSAGSSDDSGNNNGWNISASGNPTISSAANQTFALSQATTPISTITVTDYSVATITAANDIRIKIATSTVRMKWDTTDTTATFGGTASAKVSNPVSYEGEGSVLVIPVGTNFNGSDTLTIADLSFSEFTDSNTALNALSLYTNGATDTVAEATDDKTVTINGVVGTLTLGNHTAGQASDAFQTTDDTTVDFARMRLTPTGEDSSISSLIFTLTGVDGVVNADLTNVKLYRDMNSDGAYDVGDVQVGGAGAVSISGQTGSITFSSTFTSTTTTQNFILVGDYANVRPGDRMTVRLESDGITSVGASTAGTITLSGSISAIQHLKNGGGGGSSGSSGAIGGEAPTSTPQGGGDEGNATSSGAIGGDAPTSTPQGGGGGGGGGEVSIPSKHFFAQGIPTGRVAGASLSVPELEEVLNELLAYIRRYFVTP